MIDIPNLQLPVATVIHAQWETLSAARKQQLLEGQTEEDFLSARMDILLEELENALLCGYDELGAKEVALQACLTGITETDE